MADPKGDKLYVNLSASQTRRRLKCRPDRRRAALHAKSQCG